MKALLLTCSFVAMATVLFAQDFTTPRFSGEVVIMNVTQSRTLLDGTTLKAGVKSRALSLTEINEITAAEAKSINVRVYAINEAEEDVTNQTAAGFRTLLQVYDVTDATPGNLVFAINEGQRPYALFGDNAGNFSCLICKNGATNTTAAEGNTSNINGANINGTSFRTEGLLVGKTYKILVSPVLSNQNSASIDLAINPEYLTGAPIFFTIKVVESIPGSVTNVTSNEVITITNDDNYNYTINSLTPASTRIFDLSGRMIKDFGTSQDLSINLSSFNKGFYFIKVSAQGQSLTKKVLVN